MARIFAWIIAAFVFAGCVGLSTINNQENEIKQEIESINGEVIDIEHRSMYKGPYWYSNTHSNVYKVIYTQDNEEKIGWVKFGLFSSDYKLDYKK